MQIDIDKIAYILQVSKTIAVVGLSPKPERDSYRVSEYLLRQGYNIIPVNPGHSEILGRKSYPSLFDIPESVDIIDIFRRSESVPPIVRAAIQIQAPYIWMQEGVEHEEAAAIARQHDVTVIQNLCLKKMHYLCDAKGLL